MTLIIFLMSCFVVLIGLVFFILVVGLCYFYGGVIYRKRRGFECGFQPFIHAGNPFSIPFFVISLIFLLFDVEIILIRFPPFCGIYRMFF